MNVKNRLKALRKIMTDKGLDGFIINSPDKKIENRRYMSGFSGSTGVLYIDSNSALIAADSRYFIQVARECPDFKLVKFGLESPYSAIMKVKDLSGKKVGFEADILTVSQHKNLRKALKGVKLVETSGIIMSLRSIKDNDEIAKIRAAQKITDNTFKQLLKIIKPGMTELEAAWIIEKLMREQGAEKISFPVIAASGPNSALPHAVPSTRKVKKGEPFLFDYGCVVDGYCSDMTRTVFVGKPSEKMKSVYNRVLEAHLLVFELSGPGKKVADIDRISRELIHETMYKDKPMMGKEKGMGLYEHGLGHGVGLEVHEEPVLSIKRKDDILKVGHVVTNEPGIYIEGEGGVRIEDMMYIVKDGAQSLTGSPKEMIIL